jgi:hypothetical protein
LNQAVVPYERWRKRRRRKKKKMLMMMKMGAHRIWWVGQKIAETPMNQEEAQFLGSLPRLPLLCGPQTWKPGALSETLKEAVYPSGR